MYVRMLGNDPTVIEELRAAVKAGWEFSTYMVRPMQVDREVPMLPRYMLGVYREEQEEEMGALGQAHFTHNLAYVDWWDAIPDMTPLTWTAPVEIPQAAYPVVVKGKIHSKKGLWPRLMVAQTYADALRISSALYDDAHISRHGLIYRDMEDFAPVEHREVGPPAINEWRVFALNGIPFISGYYWHDVECPYPPRPKFLRQFVQKVLTKANKTHPRGPLDLTCVDVGVKPDGILRVIEINDGRQAGLQAINPLDFYRKLRILTRSLIDNGAPTR